GGRRGGPAVRRRGLRRGDGHGDHPPLDRPGAGAARAAAGEPRPRGGPHLRDRHAVGRLVRRVPAGGGGPRARRLPGPRARRRARRRRGGDRAGPAGLHGRLHPQLLRAARGVPGPGRPQRPVRLAAAAARGGGALRGAAGGGPGLGRLGRGVGAPAHAARARRRPQTRTRHDV
ncbi:MAG: Transcriptional regulator, MerR family, partial [uncultured Solirubrobacteraceae bacterium]